MVKSGRQVKSLSLSVISSPSYVKLDSTFATILIFLTKHHIGHSSLRLILSFFWQNNWKDVFGKEMGSMFAVNFVFQPL